jgi:hypothetical protein
MNRTSRCLFWELRLNIQNNGCPQPLKRENRGKNLRFCHNNYVQLMKQKEGYNSFSFRHK